MSRSYWMFYYNIICFLFSFQTFPKLKTLPFTIKTLQFEVSNNETEWILDFGPDSMVLSVKDLDENLTISSLEVPLAAWSLFLSQRQKFLDNHFPRVPITPNQQGTFQRREEVLSSVGPQNTTRGDTSYLIQKTLNSVGKIPLLIWTVFIDRELIPHFPHPSSTISRWYRPLPTQK